MRFLGGFLTGILAAIAFAVLANAIAGNYYFGFSATSAVVVAAVFASPMVILPLLLGRARGPVFFAFIGALASFVVYLLNVYMGWNPGFQLVPMLVGEALGVTAALGAYLGSRMRRSAIAG
jgi:hypothetical protein